MVVYTLVYNWFGGGEEIKNTWQAENRHARIVSKEESEDNGKYAIAVTHTDTRSRRSRESSQSYTRLRCMRMCVRE